MPRKPRTTLSTEELRLARDMGAATYLSAYIHLMAQELGIKDDVLTNESANAMAELMIEPLNLSTEMVFRKLMGDDLGARETVLKLRRTIDLLPKG